MGLQIRALISTLDMIIPKNDDVGKAEAEAASYLEIRWEIGLLSVISTPSMHRY
jgi:hypothetical protein